jgi:hypothetical protein
MIPSATKPTIGFATTRSSGRNAIRAIPTPAIDPSRPARGSADRTRFPASESPILNRPIITVTAMPTFHASIASPVVR